MSTFAAMLSTQYRTMFVEIHRALDPVAGFAIFNECVPPYTWSVAHVSVAPLAPGSAFHNDGFPLSKPPMAASALVELRGESSKSSKYAVPVQRCQARARTEIARTVLSGMVMIVWYCVQPVDASFRMNR